jgi:hypothetical protein
MPVLSLSRREHGATHPRQALGPCPSLLLFYISLFLVWSVLVLFDSFMFLCGLCFLLVFWWILKYWELKKSSLKISFFLEMMHILKMFIFKIYLDLKNLQNFKMLRIRFWKASNLKNHIKKVFKLKSYLYFIKLFIFEILDNLRGDIVSIKLWKYTTIEILNFKKCSEEHAD